MAMHHWLIGVLLAGQLGLQADYTVVFETEDAHDGGTKTETVFSYKDGDHRRIDHKTAEGRLQSSILVTGGRAYLIDYDDSGPTVTDLDAMQNSDRLPERSRGDAPDGIAQEVIADWHPTGRNKTIAGIEGEVWEVASAKGDEKQIFRVVLTNAGAVRDAFEAYALLLQHIGMEEASEFPVPKEGMIAIEYGDIMRLTRFDTDRIDDEAFSLPDGVPAPKMLFANLFGGGKAPDEKKRVGNEDACYVRVCCGHVRGGAEILPRLAAASVGNYVLKASATCDFLGIGALFGVNSVEGALYQDGLNAVTVTLDMNAKDMGKVRRMQKSTLNRGTAAVDGFKEGKIKGRPYYYGILKPEDVQTLDIVMDEHTVISFSHLRSQGELSMIEFADAAIDFSAYNTESKPEQTSSRDNQDHNGSESVQKAPEGHGLDGAVKRLKELF